MSEALLSANNDFRVRFFWSDIELGILILQVGNSSAHWFKPGWFLQLRRGDNPELLYHVVRMLLVSHFLGHYNAWNRVFNILLFHEIIERLVSYSV